MAYADLLAKRGQNVGFRLRICGVKYYFVSHPDVPQLSDSAGGTDYTRVVGAFIGSPRGLAEKAHPFSQPQVLSTDIELIDIDGALTDMWATERSSPITTLSAALTAIEVAAINCTVNSASEGYGAFATSGLCYVDTETIEYTTKNVGGSSLDTLTRNKYAEGFGTSAVAHSLYMLASNQLQRPIFGFLPHLWYRECILEIFDLENVANTATIARGFLYEPQWVGEEIFRFRIANYIHPLSRQIFKRTECKGELSRDFDVIRVFIPTGMANPLWMFGLPNPKASSSMATQTLYANVKGTQEIADTDAFFEDSDIPGIAYRWMPSKQMYLLVGGDDGELMAYSDWDADSTDGAFTIVQRGLFGTPIGKDNGGIWPKGTPIQTICALVGDPSYSRIDPKTYVTSEVSAWINDIYLDHYMGASLAGVNPINAMLMLLVSIVGDGANSVYDNLPSDYGLGIPYGRIDITAFEAFRMQAVPGEIRQHCYLGKEPESIMDMIMSDVQMLYGGMIYATREGQISIAELRLKVPSDTATAIAEKDIVSIETVGVRDVYNTLRYTLDQWPSENETVVNAYDYRRRDAMGESNAHEVTSKSLRGNGFRSASKFLGESVVMNSLSGLLCLLGNGAPMVEMTLTAKHADLSPGSYVTFTHSAPPRITANARGFSTQTGLILEAEPHDEEAEIRVKAVLLRTGKTCLWGPSAEISARTSDTEFTIKAAVFNADDRQTAFWDVDTTIRVWNAAMTSFTQCVIATWTLATGTITLDAPGSANVQANNRITWDDWDTGRAVAGGVTQYARTVTEVWYGYCADASHSLGAAPDAAREWL
jgi:hypothetical protein